MYQLRFIAGKIIQLNGEFSSKPCLIIGKEILSDSERGTLGQIKKQHGEEESLKIKSGR